MSLKILQKYVKDKPEILIFGEKQCSKFAKSGQLKEVFIARDCLERIEKKAENFAKISDTVIYKLEKDKDELSLITKKKFPISIIGAIDK